MERNPCLNCGACCAFYRASFYWGETDISTPEGVPSDMTTRLSPFLVAMKGTTAVSPRCIALEGSIGREVYCTIYDRRSSVCREFEPSWQGHGPNPRCSKARLAWGLKPLSPDAWFEPGDLPKAA